MSLRSLAGAVLALALAACATAPPHAAVEPRVVPAFDAGGRLSARHGSDGVAVHFTWSHAAGDDTFDVATPLGQTVARLRGDAAGIFVERPGEPPRQYPDWDALTQAVIGVPLPVRGLASWVQGAPAPGTASAVERDGAGRPQVLRQQGWEIVYAYGDDAADTRPARLVMRYPAGEPVEVRIVVDRFAAVTP
ncbi:MAG: outer membrane lipoprotein LolB [Burkholderiales bacterium]